MQRDTCLSEEKPGMKMKAGKTKVILASRDAPRCHGGSEDVPWRFKGKKPVRGLELYIIQ